MENSLQQLHEANEQCRHANAHNKGFTVSQSGSPKPFELRGRSEVYVHVFVLDFFYCVYMPVYVLGFVSVRTIKGRSSLYV
jgi:hypothetical protein